MEDGCWMLEVKKLKAFSDGRWRTEVGSKKHC